MVRVSQEARASAPRASALPTVLHSTPASPPRTCHCVLREENSSSSGGAGERQPGALGLVSNSAAFACRDRRGPSVARARPTVPTTPAARVDVHRHFVPSWSADAAIEFMDSVGTAKATLSLTAPSVAVWEGEERREMARRVNDFSAALVSK